MCLIRNYMILPDDLGDEHHGACRNFIDGIQQRNGIILNPFDLDTWGKGAESTLLQSNRMTQHPRLAVSDLATITQQVWNELSTVQFGDFDCAFFKLACGIRQAYLPFMTFGRTQKFINMLCKYAYCYYWSWIDPAWNATNPWVRILSPYFHIPVDAIVLHNLRQENRNWFAKLITTPIIQKGQKYARIRHGDTDVGWSVLDRAYPYIAVQQYVLDNLRGAATPMHREMRDLWR